MRISRILPFLGMLATSAIGVAATVTYNFDDNALPSGDSLRGTAALINGQAQLTTAADSLTGSYIVQDLDPGMELTSFNSTFDIFIGGGNVGADGLSFSFGEVLSSTMAFGEGGPRSGLTISFDSYGGGGPEGIDIRYFDRLVYDTPGSTGSALRTNSFVPVTVSFNNTTGLSLSYNGTSIVTGLDLNGAEPGFGFFHTGSRFSFNARTGGFNDNHAVDNVFINTTAGAITRQNLTQPGDAVIMINGGAPDNEGVTLSIDNDWGTKYLNFDGDDTGLQITPSIGATIVSAFTLTSANDDFGRDPTSFTLMGSNNGIDFEPIASGSVPDFPNRYATQLFEISNSTAYTSYRLMFPTVDGAPLMQIAEVELIGQAVPEPSSALLAVTAAFGLLGIRRRRAV